MRAEELVDGAQVDRQGVDLAVVRGVHAVHVVRERGEPVHVVPHALVGRVEQVGAVLVDLRAGLLVHIRVGVAADVIADIDDVHAAPVCSTACCATVRPNRPAPTITRSGYSTESAMLRQSFR